MLSAILDGEYSFEDLLFVADQIGHDLAIDGIYNPDHIVFTTCHKYRCRLMPLDKVHVLLWYIFEGLLECEAIINIPDAQEVIHSTSNEPFACCIELAILNRLCVTRKFAKLLNGMGGCSNRGRFCFENFHER